VIVSGETVFASPRADVFRALTQPETLVGAVPGTSNLEVRDERHWSARVRIPLARIPLRLKVEFELVEVDAPEHARLVARGRGPGGSLTMETSFDLHDVASGTHMAWTADVTLGGPAGRVAGPLLRPLVDRQVGAVLRAVGERARAGNP
jgi:carbon monoxide dehydrogenase subunit G